MFIYCPNCTNKLNNKTERLIICNKCSLHFYLSPAVTNGLIIKNQKGEILLVKRKHPPKQNHWDVPGGFVDFGESIEESVRREIREELEFDLKNFHYFASYHDRYLYKNINYHTLMFVFVAEIKNQSLKPKDDITEIRFFPPKKIPYETIAFDGVKKALKEYLIFSSLISLLRRPSTTKA